MKETKDSNIILCSIVRNAEKGLRRNIPVVKNILSQFKDYRVVVYENDSVDGTKELLREWMDSDKKRVMACINDADASMTIPIATSVPGVSPFFCHKRIDKMARLRNMYMEIINANQYDNDNIMNRFEADYLMVVDLDVSKLDADAVMTSFANGVPEWDAVTSFGYSTSPKLKRRYHDSYALTIWEDKDKVQTEDMIVRNAFRYGSLKAKDEWVRVASAFGGLAIYKYEAVRGLYYSTPALENHDPRVEVKCEHFSLYKQMIERGYDKIFINPAMTLKYSDLTLKTIWNSLHQSTFLDYYMRKVRRFVGIKG